MVGRGGDPLAALASLTDHGPAAPSKARGGETPLTPSPHIRRAYPVRLDEDISLGAITQPASHTLSR